MADRDAVLRELTVRKYREADLAQRIAIWKEVVEQDAAGKNDTKNGTDLSFSIVTEAEILYTVTVWFFWEKMP